MAEAPSPPASTEPTAQQPEPKNPTPQPNQPDPSPSPVAAPPLSSLRGPSLSTSTPSAVTVNPSPTPPPVVTPAPPSVHPYAPLQMSGGVMVPPTAPSFRPASQPLPLPTPQFSPIPNPGLQGTSYHNLNPGVQNPSLPPPGVSPSPVMLPGVASSAGSAGASVTPVMSYQVPAGQPPNLAMRPFAPVPNGLPTPPGAMPPPGIARYPSPYTPMIRSAFPPRPPGAVGVLPVLSRPIVPGIRGPVVPPVVRPAVVPAVTSAEKPQTTVYIGKIAPTVENDFMLSLLRLCGPVKSWKRAQDPTNGTPKGFGFCEFENAEGVLRALRLLSKFSVDGQELVLNVNQATKDFLTHYVEKKTENLKKPKETEAEGDDKKENSEPPLEKDEPSKPSVEESKKDANEDSGNKESSDSTNFGIVNNEDKEADQEALEKITSMIEERLKTKPLPPPPTQGVPDVSGSSNLEMNAKSRDGDADANINKNDVTEDKNEDDSTNGNQQESEQDKHEGTSPDRGTYGKRHDRSRDRDKEREKREKERELERYERERERERVRRERERESKFREAEQFYKERVKDWEMRERDKESQRLYEKDREKERQHQRRKEIRDQERESSDDDDDSRKRRRRLEEKRRRRLREKEEDLVDRIKEEEEIAEAKRRADEEQKQLQLHQKDELKPSDSQVANGIEKTLQVDAMDVESKDTTAEHAYDDTNSGHGINSGESGVQNGNGEDSIAVSDGRQTGTAPARKLGFGLMSSGKRTAVPSVFHEEDDDDAHKEKKMRPLVPIDYSTEELQAVQPTTSEATPTNLFASAEALKRSSSINPKEEKPDGERERSKRSHDRSNHRDRGRNDGDNRSREENREKSHQRDRDREHGPDKLKTSDNKKLLDAKQLIDMIPKTKEELFSYEINWSIYDQHGLHERMRPWISKKITEYLGEEEATLVDYIVDSTQNHVKASQMLELLQSILDDEAEMFVLKMWRMLIFEIKKVETGLVSRSKS